MYNIMGDRILELFGGKEETEVKLPEYNYGLYLLKIVKEGKQRTYKLIIQ
jgi:hypothetical protein